LEEKDRLLEKLTVQLQVKEEMLKKANDEIL